MCNSNYLVDVQCALCSVRCPRCRTCNGKSSKENCFVIWYFPIHFSFFLLPEYIFVMPSSIYLIKVWFIEMHANIASPVCPPNKFNWLRRNCPFGQHIIVLCDGLLLNRFHKSRPCRNKWNTQSLDRISCTVYNSNEKKSNQKTCK